MRRAERSLSSGSRAAQPSSTFDRSTPALAHTKPCLVSLMMRSPRRRMIRTDSRLDDRLVAPRVGGVDLGHGALGLRHDLLGDDDDVAVAGGRARPPAIRPARSSPAAPRGCPRSGTPRGDAHASTTSASACASAGAAHDRGGHHAPDALGLDGAGVVGVGLVDHERGHQRSVEAGDADHRGLVAQLAQQPVGRALERGAGDDRRHRDAVGAAGRPPRRARPGTASTGSIDTSGFDGAITTRRAPVERLEDARRRACVASAPSKRTDSTATSWCRCTKYSWNPISPSPGDRDPGLQPVVGDREQAQPEPPRAGRSRRSPRRASRPPAGGRCGTGGWRGRGRRG